MFGNYKLLNSTGFYFKKEEKMLKEESALGRLDNQILNLANYLNEHENEFLTKKDIYESVWKPKLLSRSDYNNLANQICCLNKILNLYNNFFLTKYDSGLVFGTKLENPDFKNRNI